MNDRSPHVRHGAGHFAAWLRCLFAVSVAGSMSSCCSVQFTPLPPSPPASAVPAINGPWVDGRGEVLQYLSTSFGLNGRAYLQVQTVAATPTRRAACGLLRYDPSMKKWQHSALPICIGPPVDIPFPTGTRSMEAVTLARSAALVTRDGGSTWTPTGAISSVIATVGVVSARGKPGTVFAQRGQKTPIIYESHDYGANWVSRTDWSLLAPNLGADMQFVLGDHLLAWATLRNVQAVYTGGMFPWKQISLTPANTSTLSMSIAPDGKSLSGQFWNASMKQHSFCRFTPIATVPFWGLKHCTVTGVAPQFALAWERYFSANSFLLFTPWAAVRSDDDGSSFTTILAMPSGERLVTVFPISDQQVFSVSVDSGGSYKLAYSPNRGQNWEILP